MRLMLLGNQGRRWLTGCPFRAQGVLKDPCPGPHQDLQRQTQRLKPDCCQSLSSLSPIEKIANTPQMLIKRTQNSEQIHCNRGTFTPRTLFHATPLLCVFTRSSLAVAADALPTSWKDVPARKSHWLPKILITPASKAAVAPVIPTERTGRQIRGIRLTMPQTPLASAIGLLRLHFRWSPWQACTDTR